MNEGWERPGERAFQIEHNITVTCHCQYSECWRKIKKKGKMWGNTIIICWQRKINIEARSDEKTRNIGKKAKKRQSGSYGRERELGKKEKDGKNWIIYLKTYSMKLEALTYIREVSKGSRNAREYNMYEGDMDKR